MVTPELFRRFPTPQAMAKATLPRTRRPHPHHRLLPQQGQIDSGRGAQNHRRLQRQGSADAGRTDHHPRRRPQDSQRGPRRLLRQSRRRRRGHARLPHRPPPRTGQGRHAAESRAGVDAAFCRKTAGSVSPTRSSITAARSATPASPNATAAIWSSCATPRTRRGIVRQRVSGARTRRYSSDQPRNVGCARPPAAGCPAEFAQRLAGNRPNRNRRNHPQTATQHSQRGAASARWVTLDELVNVAASIPLRTALRAAAPALPLASRCGKHPPHRPLAPAARSASGITSRATAARASRIRLPELCFSSDFISPSTRLSATYASGTKATCNPALRASAAVDSPTAATFSQASCATEIPNAAARSTSACTALALVRISQS